MKSGYMLLGVIFAAFNCALAEAQPVGDNSKPHSSSDGVPGRNELPAAPKGEVIKAPLLVESLIIQIDDPGDGSVIRDIRTKIEAAQGGLDRVRRILNDLRSRQAFIVLAKPTMHFGEAMPGAYFVGDEREIQYMQPAENGLFRLTNTKPTRLGMELSLKAKSDRATNRFTLDPVELTLYAIEGREQIAGTELAIGKPRIVRKSISTSMELYAHQFGIVELQVSDKRHVWVVLNAAFSKDAQDSDALESKVK